MSLYAEYVRERTNDEIIEISEIGFTTYRFLNEKQVYIVDIYVVPKMRKCGTASGMADTIVDIARSKGCTEILGTVVPSAKNADSSMNVLLAYGMRPCNIDGQCVVFKKEI